MNTTITQATSPGHQFNIEGVGSPRGKRFNTAAELEAHLADWVDAAPTRLPYELREQAADVIRTCWLEKAESLTLTEMNLSRLPDVVFEMDHLRLLNLSANHLTGLPDTVGALTGLKTLNLSRNPLRMLPKNLPALEGLMLTGVDLEQYPRHLFELPRDCMVYLRGVTLDQTEENWLATEMESHPHGPTIDTIGLKQRATGGAPALGRTSAGSGLREPTNKVIGFGQVSPDFATAPALGLAQRKQAPALVPTATSAPVPISQAAGQRASETSHEVPVRDTLADNADLTTATSIRVDTRLTKYGVDRGLCLELRAWIHSAADDAAENRRRSAARVIQICIDREGTQLCLGDLGLTDLPEILWTQTQLNQLHLGGNQLSDGALPAAIGNLKNLSHLLLPDNRLSGLPPQVAMLSKLRVLDLSTNFFVNPPAAIAQMSKLEYLYLGENPIWNRRARPAVPATCFVTY